VIALESGELITAVLGSGEFAIEAKGSGRVGGRHR
jgi:hypothetical protein